jgi:hypothetical protein
MLHNLNVEGNVPKTYFPTSRLRPQFALLEQDDEPS